MHFNGITQNIESPNCDLRQSVQSLRSSSGHDCRITSWSGELWREPKAPGQLDKKEVLSQFPQAETQANEERQGNLLQEYEERFGKLSENQKLSKPCSEAGLRQVEIGQFFCALPSPREKGNISMPRIYDASRSRRNSHQRVDPKQCTSGLVSDMKVCNHNGRYNIEVQVQTLFQDQTVWIRIVNGLVREVMPIQEEENASEKPVAKARPILKSSS